jgi:hypothetical protein
MAARKVSSLLRFVVPVVILVILIAVFAGKHSPDKNNHRLPEKSDKHTSQAAANDSAAESLDTLTAELAATKQQVTQITQDNAELKSQNQEVLKKLQGSEESSSSSIAQEVEQLKQQIGRFSSHNYNDNNPNISQPITTVPDLTDADKNIHPATSPLHEVNNTGEIKPKKPIPYYTIPANATAVQDKLMTALVGRIPIKGVVTDPYPFKIVFSDDTLAANGLRVPHLKQMIVSGYSEGDLNLVSVRGWVTSLTFVFDDGTISTTTSNNNDIGHFTKENAIGFLSDPRGNPFIRGKLITNAPSYLTGNVLLGAAQGAATAYAQTQTTNQTSPFGSTTSTVTGSPTKFVLGQSGVNATNQAQQWWHDREENSFDAVYVPSGEEIVVNFAKEISIDYNPQGRKIDYENTHHSDVIRSLD